MCEIETYYSSLSEIKWFSGCLLNHALPDTWQINASNRRQHPAHWEASVSESQPAYETPVLFHQRPVAVIALN